MALESVVKYKTVYLTIIELFFTITSQIGFWARNGTVLQQITNVTFGIT